MLNRNRYAAVDIPHTTEGGLAVLWHRQADQPPSEQEADVADGRTDDSGDGPTPEEPNVAPPIRTTRVEVVDSEGRVRALIGEQAGSGPNGLPVYGIALFGPSGGCSVSIVEDSVGAIVSLFSAGNVALVLGVNDLRHLVHDSGDLTYVDWRESEEGGPPGPYATAFAPEGEPVVDWSIAWGANGST